MEKETLRQLLEKEKTAISERLQRIDAHHAGHTVSKQFDEANVDRSNEEVIEGLEREGRDELRAIEKAIARLATDSYATCAGCGETISDERLKVIPYTTFCRSCAT